MKPIIIAMAMGLFILASCSSGAANSKDIDKTTTDSTKKMDMPSDSSSITHDMTRTVNPIKSITTHYFDLKNALTRDDGKTAADAGKAMVVAIDKMDTTQIPASERKVFNDLSSDIRENAEHIGANPDKIEHQREHFEMLSKDIYDLIKTSGIGQTTYRDFCPMYNNGKGAYWVSEIKEIKNPYLGKKMQTCGSIKSEIN